RACTREPAEREARPPHRRIHRRRLPLVLQQRERAGPLEACLNGGPVEYLPDVLDVVRPLVLVMEVVRMFPGVDDEERKRARYHVVLMIVDLLDHEALPERLPGEGAPAGALDDSLPSKGKEPLVFYGVPTRAGDRGRTGGVQLGK